MARKKKGEPGWHTLRYWLTADEIVTLEREMGRKRAEDARETKPGEEPPKAWTMRDVLSMAVHRGISELASSQRFWERIERMRADGYLVCLQAGCGGTYVAPDQAALRDHLAKRHGDLVQPADEGALRALFRSMDAPDDEPEPAGT